MSILLNRIKTKDAEHRLFHIKKARQKIVTDIIAAVRNPEPYSWKELNGTYYYTITYSSKSSLYQYIQTFQTDNLSSHKERTMLEGILLATIHSGGLKEIEADIKENNIVIEAQIPLTICLSFKSTVSSP